MREIEFRGQVAWNGNHRFKGDWIYGYYVDNLVGNSFIFEVLDEFENIVFNQVEVIEETVGRFTGLLDKNKQKIYDGDILRQTGFFLTRQYDEVVTFVDGGFYPFCIKGWECELDSDTYEVIGNIHENPELLKEE